MRTRLSLGAALVVAMMLPSARAKAAGKGASQLLGSLAQGTLENVVGNEVSSVLTNLGVFNALGLGSGPDPVLEAQLLQIISQLKTIQADIQNLKTEIATPTSTVIAEGDLVMLQSLLHDMDDAGTNIQLCAQQVALVAQAPGTSAADDQMRSFALQMVGRTAGPCDLTNEFSIIHSRIVTDQVLGSAETAVYSALARVASANGIEFERIASHFIQFSITQREALELIRGAYSALGEPDNLKTVLTQPPSDFLNKLRDEEVAFLVATDTYITAGSPPYDTSPAALADAIVQRLESVPIEATSFSLALLDDETPLTPALHSPSAGAAPVAMSDVIMGAMSSYYGTPDATLTSGIASCRATSPTGGFSYVRPFGGVGGGFKIGSSCTLHLERHLARNLPPQVDATWTIDGRQGPSPVGPFALRNAATLADETPAEALALAGDVTGRGSGFSAFTLVADGTDPSMVTLTIDLPAQAGAHVGGSTPHAFAAGATAIAFKRVPFGPQYPDRYALESAGQYLSVGSDGFAALSATPVWFDLQQTPDGHVELDYDGGVLYVDHQYQQVFHGESPDDVWADSPNLAMGAAAAVQWAVPNDGVPRVAPTTALTIGLPCLTSAGAPSVGKSFVFSPVALVDSTRCSDANLPYVEYQVTLTNQDSMDRAIQLTIAGQATGVSVADGAPYTGMSYAGLHCYGAGQDHLDTGSVGVAPGATGTTANAMFNVTVPANGSTQITCQALDLVQEPALLTLNTFHGPAMHGRSGWNLHGVPVTSSHDAMPFRLAWIGPVGLVALAACGKSAPANGGDGGGGTGGGTPTAFTSFQAAETVIGQADFASSTQPATPSASTTDSPLGSGAFDGQNLFLPDTYTHRALGFSSVPTSNGAAAALVLGQASVSTSTPGTTGTTWYLPQSLHTDGTTLAIADAGNNRVLLLASHTASTAAPTVVGWPDASMPSTGCTAAELRSPAAAFLVAGKLLVADRGNNRVLIWNATPSAGATPADLVLGQTTMTSCVSNDSLSNSTSGLRSAATLSGPADVWSDGTRVVVADRGNNRLLVWSTFPTASGAAADLVLGQTDFTLARDDATASVLLQPSAIASAAGRLFVADAGHNRILGWSAWPTSNGAAADLVLGQGSFTFVAANDDAQTGTAGTAPTARTLSYPTGVALAGTALVVSDSLNRRFLVFRSH